VHRRRCLRHHHQLVFGGAVVVDHRRRCAGSLSMQHLCEEEEGPKIEELLFWLATFTE
jgi:hypothetical protein